MQFFRAPNYGFDAAQAVLAVFRGPDGEGVASREKSCARPEQVCGALAAAKELRPDLEDIIEQEFLNHTKSTLCGDLLGKGQLDCASCVRVACNVLEDYGTPIAEFAGRRWYTEVEDITKVFR